MYACNMYRYMTSWIRQRIWFCLGSGLRCHPPLPVLASSLPAPLPPVPLLAFPGWVGGRMQVKKFSVVRCPTGPHPFLAHAAVKHAKQLVSSAQVCLNRMSMKTLPSWVGPQLCQRKGAKSGASPVCAEMYVCMYVCMYVPPGLSLIHI